MLGWDHSMTQTDAAQLLQAFFYEWVPSKGNPGPNNFIAYVPTQSGALRLPTKCTERDMNRRRAQIGVPEDFRFAWFALPQPQPLSPEGAHYLKPCPDCTEGGIIRDPWSGRSRSMLFLTKFECATCVGHRFVRDEDAPGHAMGGELTEAQRERIVRAVAEREKLRP
jgi:hypothetical protein